MEFELAAPARWEEAARPLPDRACCIIRLSRHPGGGRGQYRRAESRRVEVEVQHRPAEQVGLDLPGEIEPGAAATHPELSQRRAGPLQDLEDGAHAERHTLDH